MKKIILFTGGVETLSYFSIQIQQAMAQKGYETFLFDMQKPLESFHLLLQFCRRGEAVLITFNFIGLSGEQIFSCDDPKSHDRRSFFDDYHIKCINVVVDHPFYYHQTLRALPKDYLQFCIDRTHMAYMKRFFPSVTLGEFFPLAGSMSVSVQNNGRLPMEQRKTGLLFTGNYTPPARFEKHLTRINEDYTAFYYGIIDDLRANPSQTMDAVFEKHILKELPDVSDEELAKCMENMIFIDLYLRFEMRGRVLCTLADAGFPIDIYGSGSELLPVKHPENLILHGPVTSSVCLQKLAHAKVSLNVMPWFKDGLHDRVINAALNGAVNLTDTSRYLCETFDEHAAKYYSLEHIDQLPSLAEALLKSPEECDRIASNAFSIASASHTWENRADILTRYFS